MKFLYEYRTKDNVRHEGVISAASRDAAFAALKAQGIRPGSVKEAPGLFNKLFGKGKRWIAIALLAIVAVISTTLVLFQPEAASLAGIDDSMRRQILGDSAIIEKGVRTGWSNVFSAEGDVFFASFALPGHPPSRIRVSLPDFEAALSSDVEVNASDSIEARQVKKIVEGMKREARAYLEAGGTVEKYIRRLIRRQQTEIGYHARAEREINLASKNKMPAVELEKLWEKRNSELRQMGIRPVAMPANLDFGQGAKR